ncbi:MAG: alpha/beta hydrolase, partial [Gemmatimonadaceae bacterium]|nr:alpha/beta hydrolase [Acetobacteraceae bacterium]
PPPDPGVFGVPPGPDADWVRRRLTPHPFGTLDSPLRLRHPIGNGRPCTYVACTNPDYAPLASHRAFARSLPGWGYRELAAGHDAMVTAPGPLVALLQELTA